MAAAVAKAVQQTQDAVQAQVASQIRWIADDLPALLKQQAGKALRQLDGLQPTIARGEALGQTHEDGGGTAADPMSGEAAAAAAAVVERPFWALPEAEVPVSGAAEGTTGQAVAAGDASEATPLEAAGANSCDSMSYSACTRN